MKKHEYCDCKNTLIGSYGRQQVVEFPWSEKIVSIDICLFNEIMLLWAFGIPTIECCCGHNKVESYIAVSAKYYDRMMALGYRQYCDDRGDIFLSRSLEFNYA